MFAAIARLIRPAAAAAPARHHMISQVIDTVGGGIAEAEDFEKLLTPALAAASAYLAGQIARLPGPLLVSAPLFGQEAATTALFADADEIARALGRSLEVKESLPELARRGHQYVHATLGVRCKAGDGQAAVFSDHTVRSLAPRESDARDYLEFVAIRRLLNDFAEHVNKLRRRERMLKQEWNIRNDPGQPIAPTETRDYVTAAVELAPDRLLRGLIAWLEAPEKYFRLASSGITLPAGGAGSTELPLLHCSDRRQWLVCLVRFPVDEGLRALAQETHTHRHIFI